MLELFTASKDDALADTATVIAGEKAAKVVVAGEEVTMVTQPVVELVGASIGVVVDALTKGKDETMSRAILVDIRSTPNVEVVIDVTC